MQRSITQIWRELSITIKFGIGFGALLMLIRVFSGYSEGLMFAVLLMNAAVPLINGWTIPTPRGGPVPKPKEG